MALWHPSSGTWWIHSSVTDNIYAIAWGVAGDLPVPGDYDGDGRADPAVFRPWESTRYILPSNGGASYSQLNMGSTDDSNMAGDYDGDGRADVITWMPWLHGTAAGKWNCWLSGKGTEQSEQWGQPGDIALGAPRAAK
jgi:hypothetical protein